MQTNWVIAGQALAVLALGYLSFSGFRVEMGGEEVEILGQTLSMLLIGGGLASHMMAKRGLVPPPLLLLLPLISPGFAAAGGLWRYVLSYFFICLAFQALVLWTQHKRLARAAASDAPEGDE